jgi:hypothetical protein
MFISWGRLNYQVDVYVDVCVKFRLNMLEINSLLFCSMHFANCSTVTNYY